MVVDEDEDDDDDDDKVGKFLLQHCSLLILLFAADADSLVE